MCACTLGVRGDPLPRDRGEFWSLDVRNANGVADIRPVLPRVGPYMFARCVCAKRVSLVKLAPLRKHMLKISWMFQCLNTRINLKELNTKNVTPRNLQSTLIDSREETSS